MDLADEAVQIDDQPRVARPGAGRPRVPERVGQHAIKLAHVSECEGAQERPERRRRRDPTTEKRLTSTFTSDITLGPGLAAPARDPRRTKRSTSASIPSRAANVIGSATPASATAR